MSRFLTLWSVVLAGAVVGLLAAYLIEIARALQRADRNLEALVGGLEAIRDQTTPLQEDLGTINEAAGILESGLAVAGDHLQAILRLLNAEPTEA